MSSKEKKQSVSGQARKLLGNEWQVQPILTDQPSEAPGDFFSLLVCLNHTDGLHGFL